MNQAPRTAWRTVLAIIIAVGAGHARADDAATVRPAWPGEPAVAGAPTDGGPQTPLSWPADSGEPGVGEAAAGLSFGHVYQPAVQPAPALAAAPPRFEPPLLQFAQRPVLAEWYTRFDYFCWNERIGATEIDSENGALYTLGYSRCFGADRFRAEIFTGTMTYGGTDWNDQSVQAVTSYLGVRGEYEWLWDMSVPGCPPTTLFAGIGTRLWIRDIKDGIVPSTGEISVGHQENWWTIYPYLGLEKRWACNPGEEIYARGRVGCTVFTYQFLDIGEGTPLYPRPDITGQIECGFRHDQLFIAVCFEAMTWNASPTVRDWSQPRSQMFVTGLKLGLSF
jgi:hypothetical protein